MRKDELIKKLAYLADDTEIMVNTKHPDHTAPSEPEYSWWDFDVDATPAEVPGETSFAILQPTEFAGG